MIIFCREKKVVLKAFTQPLRAGAGFTFIELILVTLLIGIIIGASTPVFRNFFYNFQQTNFPVNLAKLIRYAQERAIMERAEYKLKIDFEKREYWLEVKNKPLSGRFGKKFTVPGDITIEFDNPDTSSMVFYPDGRSSPKKVYLFNNKKEKITLTTENRIAHVTIIKD